MISFDTSAVVKVQSTRTDGAKIITEDTEEIQVGGEPLQLEVEEIVDVLEGDGDFAVTDKMIIDVARKTEEIDNYGRP